MYSFCVQNYTAKVNLPIFQACIWPSLSQQGQVKSSQHSTVVPLQLFSVTCGVQGASGRDRGGADWPGASLCSRLCAVSSRGVCREAWDDTGLCSGAECPSVSSVFSTSNALAFCVEFLSWSLWLTSAPEVSLEDAQLKK